MSDWKIGYREGFADGYAAAKKEMNYQNYPPVTVARTASSLSTGGLSYGINKPGPDHQIEPFVTGMSVTMSNDC